jgi:hypothetical protein
MAVGMGWSADGGALLNLDDRFLVALMFRSARSFWPFSFFFRSTSSFLSFFFCP